MSSIEDSYIDFVVTTQVINTSVAEDTEGDVAADTTGDNNGIIRTQKACQNL